MYKAGDKLVHTKHGNVIWLNNVFGYDKSIVFIEDTYAIDQVLNFDLTERKEPKAYDLDLKREKEEIVNMVWDIIKPVFDDQRNVTINIENVNLK
jgi:hypothetical protein